LEQLINNLKFRLQQPLPGVEAQYKMAPINRSRVDLNSDFKLTVRNSAVMILFCQDANQQWYIPLIERMTYGGVHSGQVSFPGGKQEENDRDLLHTALRECEEEIGLNDLEAIGSLTELYIPVSGFLVKPFVGICNIIQPSYKTQEREVKQVLHLPLEDLLNDNNILHGEVIVNEGLKIKTPYIEVETKKIWGATAMILSELRELMKTIS